MTTDLNPTRTNQQQTGGVCPAAFDLFVQKSLHWIYRPVHQEHDFGIDGYLDVVDGNSVTGASIAIQIKCGDSYISKTSVGGLKYEGELKHLNYYSNLRAPVILIVFDGNGENGRWVEFRLEKTIPGKSPEKWWIEIPSRNALVPSIKDEWQSIAGPCIDFC